MSPFIKIYLKVSGGFLLLAIMFFIAVGFFRINDNKAHHELSQIPKIIQEEVGFKLDYKPNDGYKPIEYFFKEIRPNSPIAIAGAQENDVPACDPPIVTGEYKGKKIFRKTCDSLFADLFHNQGGVAAIKVLRSDEIVLNVQVPDFNLDDRQMSLANELYAQTDEANENNRGILNWFVNGVTSSSQFFWLSFMCLLAITGAISWCIYRIKIEPPH